ncbi:hypothetical protein AVEN_258786-1 [Araneus ventricosus]|uniref:DDE-1 domain-containing protein n=1 Tax=Araneus ventricosus TaxID=182803 RepID=A0A4Y2D0G6_ARAVE|nr:hypothetical protein AVEN_258786-1 [Araneus ventricosus]
MDQGVIESVKESYRRKLLTTLNEEGSKNIIVIDLLKQIKIKDDMYMIAESCLELPESTLVKSWQKIWLSNQIGEEEAVVSTEISPANFLSAFKDLDGCQDVFAEDVEQWLAVDKDLQQETLSDKDIVGAVTDGVQDDNHGDDIVDNTTSLIWME